MNIVRYFIAQQDQDMGSHGWLPMWIPKSAGFNSFDIVGCMHDTLEHRLCDRGHYHEEVMAFGRMAVLRGLNDVHSGRGMRYSAPESAGLELSGICLRSADVYLPPAPETAPTDCHFEEYIETLMKHYLESGISEYDSFHDTADGTDYAREFFDTAHLESIVGWLRIGYLDGCRRYGHPDHKAMDIAQAAWGWAKRMNRDLTAHAEEFEGSVLRIIVDTDECRVRHTIIEPDYEYGEFPRWLRNRIWSWRNDSVRSPAYS